MFQARNLGRASYDQLSPRVQSERIQSAAAIAAMLSMDGTVTRGDVQAGLAAAGIRPVTETLVQTVLDATLSAVEPDAARHIEDMESL